MGILDSWKVSGITTDGAKLSYPFHVLANTIGSNKESDIPIEELMNFGGLFLVCKEYFDLYFHSSITKYKDDSVKFLVQLASYKQARDGYPWDWQQVRHLSQGLYESMEASPVRFSQDNGPIINKIVAEVNNFIKNIPSESQEKNTPVKITSQVNKNLVRHSISPVDNKNEEQIYLQIYDELENKTYDKALWIRLFAEENGDENKTKAHYVRQRYSILKSLSLSPNMVTKSISPMVESNQSSKIKTTTNVKDEFFPFNKFAIIDTVRGFDVDKETAKKILNFSIEKVKESFLYKNLKFKSLDEALKHAEINHQHTQLPTSNFVKKSNLFYELNFSTPKNLKTSINKDEFFPFNKFTVIDTIRKFDVDRETAKKILNFNIRKSKNYFLYMDLTFKTLEEALSNAESNPQK